MLHKLNQHFINSVIVYDPFANRSLFCMYTFRQNYKFRACQTRPLRAVCEPGYHLVLLDFGTNDLAAGCSAELLADRVIAVAETLLGTYGVKRVVVMEVFPRTHGRYRYPPTFNLEARRYNILIRDRLSSSPQIHFHHHQGLVANWQQYLVDGVHLTERGLAKYSTSVRRAILRHSSRYPDLW